MIVLVHFRVTTGMVGVVLIFRGKAKTRLRLATLAKFRPAKTEILSHGTPPKLNSLGAGSAH